LTSRSDRSDLDSTGRGRWGNYSVDLVDIFLEIQLLVKCSGIALTDVLIKRDVRYCAAFGVSADLTGRGRLEKRKSIDDLAMSQECQNRAIAHRTTSGRDDHGNLPAHRVAPIVPIGSRPRARVMGSKCMERK
jgi:hypothetical protein